MISLSKDVIREQSKLERQFNEEDQYVKLFKQPHSITALLLALSVLVYFAFTRDDSEGIESNSKVGLLAICLIYLFLCAFQMRDGLFIRPHPLIWRVTMGMSVIYFLGMTFLLFQSRSDARALFKYWDNSLGEPLPERSYAEDCRIYTPENPDSPFINVWNTLNDEFVLAHLLGWFGKAILLRDFYLCWTLSILFELLELSLQHLLPNFAECWWDHIIIDIFVCNALGIYLGLKVCEWFRMKPYHWVGKIRPELESYSWDVFSSWRRLFAVVLLVATVSLIELNAFFLKFILWLPPPNPLVIGRLIMWWGIGQPGVREFYQWVTDKNCKRFGTMAWMCAAVVIVELLVEIKFSRGMFPEPHPPVVIATWAAAFLLFGVATVWYYALRPQQKNKQKNKTQ